MKTHEQNVSKFRTEIRGEFSALLVIMFSFISVYAVCLTYGALDLIPHANFIFSTAVFGLGFIIAYGRIRYLENLLDEHHIDFD